MKNNVEIKKYPSGAQILLEKDVTAPYIAFAFNVFSGSFDDNVDEFGVAHFVEHMVFKSTKNRTFEEINKEMEAMGTSMGASTSYSITRFYFKCLKETFDKSAEIYGDMLTNPLFKVDEFEKERQVILEEMNMYKDDPFYNTLKISYEAMCSNFVANAHNIGGTEESVKAMTPDNLRSFMERNYFGNNIIISVCGNIEMEEVQKILEKHFKIYLFETKKTKKDAKNELPLTPQKPALSIQKDTKQVNMFVMIKGEKPFSRDEYIADLYSTILGNGFSSKLFAEIREKMGLAYTVCSFNESVTYFEFLIIYVGCNKDNLKKALTAIKNILNDMATNGVTQEELNKAKTMCKANLAYNVENREFILQCDAEEYFVTNNIRSNKERLDLINSINLEDVKNIANRILNEKIKICYASGNNINEKDLQDFLDD